MSNYAIIADNGGSDQKYRDIVGEVYTFPSNYANILLEGTKFVYQRCGLSSMKVQEPDDERLLDEPHYFGTAEIGKVVFVGDGRYEAEIINYKRFVKGVPFRLSDGSHFEVARGQFWRNGVRASIKEVYDEICKIGMGGEIPLSSPLAGMVPPPLTPVIKKQDNKRATAKNRSSVQYKTDIEEKLVSLSFADDCYTIAVNSKGYWLHSLVDERFYLIAHLNGNPANRGVIKVFPSVICHEPLLKSDKKFGVYHVFADERINIGTIEIKDDGIEFRGNGSSVKTLDVIKIPLAI